MWYSVLLGFFFLLLLVAVWLSSCSVAEVLGTSVVSQQQYRQEQQCLASLSGVSFPVALYRVRLGAFCISVFILGLRSIICILNLVCAYWA